MKNKFNFQNIVNDLKSMISPTGNTPQPDPSDALGIKLARLSVMAQELQTEHLEQGKKFAEMNALFNEVYQSLEAMRNPEKAENTEKTAPSDDNAAKQDEEN